VGAGSVAAGALGGSLNMLGNGINSATAIMNNPNSAFNQGIGPLGGGN
jgi:hypothetical protein